MGWVDHSGNGYPLPNGTLVQARRFNGDVETFRIGDAKTVARDGTEIPASRARWSAWDYFDGGPMPVKFRSYRVLSTPEVFERNTAMFREWLREPVAARILNVSEA